MKVKKLIAVIACAVLCMLISACASKTQEPAPEPEPEPVVFAQGSVERDVQGLEIVLEAGETEKLNELTELKKLSADGSECIEELYAWGREHPEVELHYTVELPGGAVLKSDDRSADLSGLSGAELKEAAEKLAYLPAVERIVLGSEDRENAPTLEDVKALLDKTPNAVCDYTVTRFGRTFNLADERLDFNHVPMYDGGAEVREILECMPNCTYLDMDTCHVSDEDMASIRDDFPSVKVVWRVWFGAQYSVRTDVEKILASRPVIGGDLTVDNTVSLKYCTDVKYLDIGHNPSLHAIDFVGYMTKLEVAVVALCHYTDASVLANCPNLEYLEIQTTWVSDLSPLAGLTNLRHLNIGYLFECTDITPLYNLTNLERLWIGCMTPIPAEQVEEFQARVPGCEINTTTEDPTEGGWRIKEAIYHEDWYGYTYIYHPRYELLREQFGYDQGDRAFSFSFNDPLYYGD